MSADRGPVVFVWPGDLHLEFPDRDNVRVAHWMADEVNTLIRPDFVQFAGDNVQHARPVEFDLFEQVHSKLQRPWHALVGDHDAHHDPKVTEYRARVGEPCGVTSLRGFRFIRLNTMEYRPLGLSPEQMLWLEYQVKLGVAQGERIVLFQHHYPFQVLEDFDGPGIADWRRIVATYPITSIFAGHTHYGQIANDGHNISIAGRSIGDPEGGEAGYQIVYLNGDDLAVTYRSHNETGPIALITSPRDVVLAIDRRHVVAGAVPCRVRTWSLPDTPITKVRGRVDGSEWFDLASDGANDWQGDLPGDRLAKGEHLLKVEARSSDGTVAKNQITFFVDRSGRYTAYPRVSPEVKTTKFC